MKAMNRQNTYGLIPIASFLLLLQACATKDLAKVPSNDAPSGIKKICLASYAGQGGAVPDPTTPYPRTAWPSSKVTTVSDIATVQPFFALNRFLTEAQPTSSKIVLTVNTDGLPQSWKPTAEEVLRGQMAWLKEVVFIKTSDRQADLVIKVGDPPTDGCGVQAENVLAYTSYHYNEASPLGTNAQNQIVYPILGAEITLVGEWMWNVVTDFHKIPPDSFDLFTSILHELGHTEGLYHNDLLSSLGTSNNNNDFHSPMASALPPGIARWTMVEADRRELCDNLRFSYPDPDNAPLESCRRFR